MGGDEGDGGGCLSVCQGRKSALCTESVRRILAFATSTPGADASGAKNKVHLSWQQTPVK